MRREEMELLVRGIEGLEAALGRWGGSSHRVPRWSHLPFAFNRGSRTQSRPKDFTDFARTSNTEVKLKTINVKVVGCGTSLGMA